MPSKGKKRLQRPLGQRRYKKLVIISTEGAKTELQYFQILNTLQSHAHIKCLKHETKSSCLYVLERIKNHLKEQGLKKRG